MIPEWVGIMVIALGYVVILAAGAFLHAIFTNPKRKKGVHSLIQEAEDSWMLAKVHAKRGGIFNVKGELILNPKQLDSVKGGA